jgi:hypothetical protein
MMTPILRFNLRRVILAVALCLAASGTARAQGDGPRVFLLSPTGLNVFSFTYMELSSNYNFAQDILVPSADLDSDVEAFAYIRFFNVGGRFAQIWLTPVFGGVGGTATIAPVPGLPPALSGTIQAPRINGWADPYVAFRVGLVGAPALTLPEFVKHKPGFQMYALLGANIPIGDYESARPVNLGTNRWAIRAGVPMVQPWGNPAKPTVLEVNPSIYFYTANDDPQGAADERTQDPLFVVESHLTHNLTPKFWVGGDLRYQVGGETKTDGIADDNQSNHAGGGFSIGYQILRPLTVIGGWGKIFAEDDGARGTMWRVRLNLVF